MFALSPINSPVGPRFSQLDTGFWDYLSAVVSSSRREGLQGNYERMLDLNYQEQVARDNGEELMSVDDLNKTLGMEGLEFKVPMYPSVAQLERQRHESLLTEYNRLSSRPTVEIGGVPTFIPKDLRGAIGFGVGLLSGLTTPLDFGTMFLPFVGGEIRLAAAVSATGRLASTRQAVARIFERGLISRSSIPLASRLPVVAPAVANNLLQQTVAESLTVANELRLQGEVNMSRLVQSMILGGFASEAVRGVFHVMSKLGPSFHTAVFHRAVDDLAAGRKVDVSQEVSVHTVELQAIALAQKTLKRDLDADLDAEVSQKVDSLSGEEKAALKKRAAELEKEIKDSGGPKQVKAKARQAAELELKSGLKDALFRETLYKLESDSGFVGMADKSVVLALAKELADSNYNGSFYDAIRSKLEDLSRPDVSNRASKGIVQEIGRLLGVKPTFSKLPMELDASAAKLAELKRDVFARGDLIRDEFRRLVDSKRKELVEANSNRIVQDGRSQAVAKQAELDSIMKQLSESVEDLAKAERLEKSLAVDIVDELDADNKAMQAALEKRLTPEEKAALRAELEEVTDGLDDGEFTTLTEIDIGLGETIVEQAASCVIKNAT